MVIRHGRAAGSELGQEGSEFFFVPGVKFDFFEFFSGVGGRGRGGGGLGSEHCRCQGLVRKLKLVKLGLETGGLKFRRGGAVTGYGEVPGEQNTDLFCSVHKSCSYGKILCGGLIASCCEAKVNEIILLSCQTEKPASSIQIASNSILLLFTMYNHLLLRRREQGDMTIS